MSTVKILRRCTVLVLAFLVMVGCDEPEEVPRDPMVCLKVRKQQCMQGILQTTTQDNTFEAFMGVPFAKPPVGELRFANPVPNDPWSGIYDARQPRAACIQRIGIQTSVGDIIGDEDCLYLNIYRPKLVVESLPVIIFIHGGSFQYGAALPITASPEYFMDNKKAILVTIPYRLGALGFLSSGCTVIPGNFGLKDQAMAIRWVRRYIHRFGGDPEKITVVGHSAGAASTQLHMMSPLSRGHFSRAVMLSGSALAPWASPKNDSAYVARQQLAALGIQNAASMSSKDILTTLRSVEAYALVKTIDRLKQMLGIARSVVVYGPVVEPLEPNQSFLSDHPQKLWDAGEYEQIPWMAGLVPNDGLVNSAIGYRLIQDPEIWAQIIPQLPYILTAAFGLDLSAGPAIKERFFPETTTPEWITPQNGDRTTDLATENGFTYPLLRSIRSHLRHGNQQEAPVTLYYFNYTGPYTIASYFVPNSGKNYRICHTDEVFYLFPNGLLFPQFAPNTPERIMAAKFVEFMVDFARYGIIQPVKGTCRNLKQCKMIEFFNSNNAKKPVGVKQIPAVDRELLAFWDDLYMTE